MIETKIKQQKPWKRTINTTASIIWGMAAHLKILQNQIFSKFAAQNKMLISNKGLLIIAILFLGMRTESIQAQIANELGAKHVERKWADQSGRFETNAVFLGVDNGNVKLKLTSGSEISVPLSKLSDVDQAWVAENHSKRSPPKSEPPKSEPPKSEPPKSEPKSEPPKKNKTKAKVATDLRLDARLKFSERLRFDADGKPETPYELVIDAVGPSAKDAIAFGWAKFESADADDGETLRAVPPVSSFFDLSEKFETVTHRGDDFFAKHPVDGVRVRFEIESGDQTWKKISNVKGSFRIKTGGERKLIKHEEAPLNLGMIENDELTSRGISVSISKIGINTMNVQLIGKDLSSVYRVAILTPEQEKLSALTASSWSRQEKGITYTFSFSPSAPADATAFIFIAENLQELEVPFEFPELEVK